MTITRVGTNSKYSAGWDMAFGGKKAKKDQAKSTPAKPKMSNAKVGVASKPKATVATTTAKTASKAKAKVKVDAKPAAKPKPTAAKPAAKAKAKAASGKKAK